MMNVIRVGDNMSWRDVFDSQKIFPCDYQECRKIAKSVKYSCLAFNGLVYYVSDANMSHPICTTEELS